jgi:hypothetical protein
MFFDPLGLAGPIQLRMRRLVQETTGHITSWDTPLKEEHQILWRELIATMQTMDNFAVKRLVAPINSTYKVHIFCDASRAGYGAVAYITHGNESTLLASLVRIVPKNMTKVSIPRLELMSACVAVQLWQEIKQALRVPPEEVNFWTDSQTSLCWIRSNPHKYKTFVCNRISKIQDNSENCRWRFCPGVENPADIVSRGCTPEELVDNKMWLHGPEWICDAEKWPPIFLPQLEKIDPLVEDAMEEEERSAFTFLSRTTVQNSFIDTLFERTLFHRRRFSYLVKVFILLVRARGFMGHKKGPNEMTKGIFDHYTPYEAFIKETNRYKSEKHLHRLIDEINLIWHANKEAKKGPKRPRLTMSIREKFWEQHGLVDHQPYYQADEYAAAENFLISYTQQHYAPDLYKALQQNNVSELGLKDKDLIHKFNLKLHNNGVIYTYGRVVTDNPQSTYKPLIWIPPYGIIALSILNETHRTHGHMGQSTCVAATRERFWIMSPSRVFSVIRKNCGHCRMQAGLRFGRGQDSALPDSRKSITRPFEVIGVDFAGPLFKANFNKAIYEHPSVKAQTKAEKAKAAKQAIQDQLQSDALPEDEPPVKNTRKRKIEKIDNSPTEPKGWVPDKLSYYVMIVTCANTRAVALYLMENIRTETMAMVWDEFASEYGTPAEVYSDNGSNLVKYEKTIYNIAKKVTNEKDPFIKWKRIPAGAPWWGGFYERVVGMMKSILYRECRHMKVPSALHANHLIKHVQHCLNHRPLWGLTQDPTSVNVITPMSFLRVSVLISQILGGDPAGQASKEALIELYEVQHRRINHLWKEFHLGYMQALRQFAKKKGHTFNTNELKEGDLVLYEAPRHVRNFWPIARISKIYRNSKGVISNVKLHKYVPNEINQPLRLQLYGTKRLTAEMKRELMGYFKEQPNTYPVQKLAPYEFWNDITDPTKKIDIPGKETDRLPAKIIRRIDDITSTEGFKPKPILRKRKITVPQKPKKPEKVFRQGSRQSSRIAAKVHFADATAGLDPIIFTFKLQDEDCCDSDLPLECKGGVVRLTLHSIGNKLPIKEYGFPIKDPEDINVNKPVTKVCNALSAVVAFCRDSPYRITQCRIDPKRE